MPLLKEVDVTVKVRVTRNSACKPMPDDEFRKRIAEAVEMALAVGQHHNVEIMCDLSCAMRKCGLFDDAYLDYTQTKVELDGSNFPK